MIGLLSAVNDGIDWSYNVKLILIVAAAVLLCVVTVLLVAEIVGKRKRRAVPESVREQPVEAAVQPETESEAVAETTVTEIVQEYKLDEEIELGKSAVLMDDGGDVGHVIVGAMQFKVRYDRSFTAKLMQSNDALKERYSKLKNELMRYALKPRMSWPNESFYKGRITYAKFAIRGKTLSLYLALPPSDYADTKYFFEDMSDVVKYAKTPMRLKLRSDRSVRWAKELIADLAAQCGLERADREDENFYTEYEETAPLVGKKLIKLYYAGERVYSVPQPESAPAVDE